MNFCHACKCRALASDYNCFSCCPSSTTISTHTFMNYFGVSSIGALAVHLTDLDIRMNTALRRAQDVTPQSCWRNLSRMRQVSEFEVLWCGPMINLTLVVSRATKPGRPRRKLVISCGGRIYPRDSDEPSFYFCIPSLFYRRISSQSKVTFKFTAARDIHAPGAGLRKSLGSPFCSHPQHHQPASPRSPLAKCRRRVASPGLLLPSSLFLSSWRYNLRKHRN